MADNDTLKRLLIKLGVDRSEFDAAVKDIRSTLDDMRSKEKSAETQKQASLKSTADAQKAVTSAVQQSVKSRNEELDLINKQEAALDNLTASEKSYLEMSKSRLSLMQQEVKESELLIKNLAKEVDLERARISLEEARFRAQMTGVRGNVSQGGTAAVISSVQSTGKISARASGQAAATSKTVAEQRQELEISRQVLTALESELRVQQSLYEAKKLIIGSVKQEIKEEQAKLVLLERQLTIQKELQSRGATRVSTRGVAPTIPQETSIPPRITEASPVTSVTTPGLRILPVENTQATSIFNDLQQSATLAQQEKVTTGTLVQSQERVQSEKMLLATMESELAIKVKDGTISKENAAAVQQMIAARKTDLGLSDTILKNKTREASEMERAQVAAQRENAERARQSQQVVHPESMDLLRQQLEATTVTEKLSRVQIEDELQKIAVKRQELITEQSILKTLGEKQGFTQAEIKLANEELQSQLKLLAVQENQLRTKKAQTGDSLFTRMGGMMNTVMQRGVASLLGVGGGTGEEAGGGMLGGVGQIAGGMLVGGVGIEAVNKLVEMVGKLKQSLIDASGPAQTFRKEFERLSQMKGIDPTDMLDKMRTATRGLVEDADLFKMANNLMRQSMSLSSDAVVKLIGDTMDLGRATGKSSEQIMNAMQMAFLNPTYGLRRLAQVTGINTDQLRMSMQGLSRDITPAQRAMIMFNSLQEQEEKMLERVGRPATTLPELLKQAAVAEKNFVDDMAQSALGAGNFGEAINKASRLLAEYRPQLEKLANTLGKDLAVAIRFVIDHIDELKRAFEILVAVRVFGWLFAQKSELLELVTGYASWGKAIADVTKKLIALAAAKKATDLVTGTPGKSTETVGGEVGGIAKQVGIGVGTQIAGEALAGGGAAEAAGGAAAGAGLATAEAGAGALAAVISGVLLPAIAAVGVALAGLGAYFIAIRNHQEEVNGQATKMSTIYSGIWILAEQKASYYWNWLKGLAAGTWHDIGEYANAEWDMIFGTGTAEKIEGWFGGVVDRLKSISGKDVIDALLGRGTAQRAVEVAEPARRQAEEAKLKEYEIKPSEAFEFKPVSDDQLAKLGMLPKAIREFHTSYQSLTQYLGKTPIQIIGAGHSAEDVKKIRDKIEDLQATLKGFTPPKPEGDQTPSLTLKLQQLKMKQDQLEAKQGLEIQKEAIADELDLWKKRYEMGLVDFKDYIEKEKALKNQQLQATITEINQERAARLQELSEQKVTSKMDDEEYYARKRAIDKEENLKIEQAKRQTNSQLLELDNQYVMDQIAARRTYLDQILKMSKDEVAQEQKNVEENFKEGKISADTYIQQRADLINQQAALTKAGLDDELNDTKKTEAEKAKIQVQENEAEVTRINDLLALYRTADQTRLQGLETTYKRIHDLYTSQQEVATAAVTSGQYSAIDAQIAGMEQMKNVNEEYLNLLTAQYNQSGNNLEVQSKIATEVGKVTKEQVQLNQEIAKAKDLGIPLAGLFGSIASELGSVLPKQWTSFFSTLSKSLDQLSKLKVTLAAKTETTGIAGTLGQAQITSPAGMAQQMFQEFSTVTNKGITNFSDSIKTAGEHAATAMGKWGTVVEELTEKLRGLKDQITGLYDQSAVKAHGEVPTTTADLKDQVDKMYSDAAAYVAAHPETPTVTPVAPQIARSTPVPVVVVGAGTSTPSTAPTPTLPTQPISTTGVQSSANAFSGILDRLVAKLNSVINALDNILQAMMGRKATGATAQVTALTQGAASALQLPQYEDGTDYVPETGPAILHEGERVVTKKQNVLWKKLLNYLSGGKGQSFVASLSESSGKEKGGDISYEEYERLLNAAKQFTPTERETIYKAVKARTHSGGKQPNLTPKTANLVPQLPNYEPQSPNYVPQLPSFIVGKPAGVEQGQKKEDKAEHAKLEALIQQITHAYESMSKSEKSVTPNLVPQLPNYTPQTPNYAPQTPNYVTQLPSYQFGTLNVPETGPALLHSGEAVLPAAMNAVLQSFISGLQSSDVVLKEFANALTVALSSIGGGIKAPVTVSETGSWSPQTLTAAGGDQAHPTVKATSDEVSSKMSAFAALVKATSDALTSLITKIASTTTSLDAFLRIITGTRAPVGAPATSAGPGTAAAVTSGIGAVSSITSTLGNLFGNQNAAPVSPSTGFAQTAFSVDSLQGQSGLFKGDAQTQLVQISASSAKTATNTDKIAQKAGQPGQPGTQGGFGSTILGKLGGQFQDLFSGSPGQQGDSPFQGIMRDATGVLQSGMSAVGSIVQTGQQLFNAPNAATGAVQGLMSGASLGMQLGGPIGAAVGAVMGPILGGIFGAKNAAAQKYVTDIKAQLKGISDAVSSGQLGLGQAMQDLQQIRSSAAAQAGSSKKNEKQWQNTIEPQIDQEIQQVENQIQQVMTQLNDSLEQITAPTAMQPFLASLDQIVQKYQEFANAAVGNTQAVANANLFLTQSLQNYLTTLGTQMNDAQQTAIQNAIQLIDLQQQQLQLDQQHAQSVYNILSQGVLARQETTAQTKGAQIEQLDEQYDEQTQQNQEQIQIAQYRYDMEQKIFGLASDRVDLENQLLAVQEVQVNQQVQSIQALMETMAAVQKVVSSGATLPASQATLEGLLGLMGLPTTGIQPGQAVATVSNVPSQYQQIVQYLATGPMPDILSLLQQSETDQNLRTMIVSELQSQAFQQQFAGAGIPMGANMQSFFNWVMQGAPGLPPPPSYDVGGYVAQTGTATVHEGEYIFPSDTFQSLITAITQLTTVINNLTGTSATATGVSGTTLQRQGTYYGTSSQGGTFLNTLTTAVTNGMRVALGLPQTSTGIPQYDEGGVVAQTGLALVHQGEVVTPVGGVGTLPSEQVPVSPVKGTLSLPSVGQSFDNAISDRAATNELNIHQTIMSLAQTRIGMETDLLTQQKAYVQLDMQRMAQMSQLLNQMANAGNPGVASFEGGLAKVYELRGRYGSAGFRRETL